MKKFPKVLLSGLVATTLLTPLVFIQAEEISREDRREDRIERREERFEKRLTLASSTQARLDKREAQIEKIEARLASTTASSTKKIEKLTERLEERKAKAEEVKDKLLNKGLKVTEVLGKISAKIQDRIDILKGKGLDLANAQARLDTANAKIDQLTEKSEDLADLLNTEMTEENREQLFEQIQTTHAEARGLAKEAHSLLVDTIKAITEILPKDDKATTTATSTEE